jgi:peptide/nickel transport system ATP-binding protein
MTLSSMELNGAGESLIELRNIRKTFGVGGMFSRHDLVALKDFSLRIDALRPTIVAVVGESGSGKTTMARILLGLEQPSSGQVLYRGTDLRKLSKEEWRGYRKDVQAIFQDPFGVYNSYYKVDHVLETPIRKFKIASSRDETRRLMEQALLAVGLRPENTLGRYPHQLSGGQRQRTMVARTLLLRPRLIVADEPVSMIDASLRVTVLRNLLQLKRQFGISLVYITHDLTTAYQISDRIIVLYQGEVVEAADPEQIVRAPQHPYTQLLIRSIPEPDPDRGWGEDDESEADLELETETIDVEAGRPSVGPRLDTYPRPESESTTATAAHSVDERAGGQ